MKATAKLVTCGMTVLTAGALLVGCALNTPKGHVGVSYAKAMPTKINQTEEKTVKPEVRVQNDTTPEVTIDEQQTNVEKDAAPQIPEETVQQQVATVEVPHTDTPVITEQQEPATEQQIVEKAPAQVAPQTPIEKEAQNFKTVASEQFFARVKPVRFPNEQGIYTMTSWIDDHTIRVEARQDNPDGTIGHLMGIYEYDLTTDQFMEMDVISGTVVPFPG